MTRLNNVNTTDLRAAIALGCQTMQRVFNADDNNVPYFGATAWPYAALAFSPDLSECHVPGRHLNALLAAEAIAGIEIDPQAIENHRQAAFFSFSGPLCLPLNRQRLDGPLANFSPHNLREGFHALYALVRYRGDARARDLAERHIAQVGALWDPERGWDVDRIRAAGLTFQGCQGPLNGEVRMVGPLVKYYAATGYAPALALALALRDLSVERFFWPDGQYDPARFITDHTHSISSSVSSLAQLGELLNDASLLDRIRAFYLGGLQTMRDAIGWAPGAARGTGSDQGEASVGGDIVETALVLGRRGYPEFFADAERILRCHLLPCQLRDVSFMRDDPNPAGIDGLRQAADRQLGAFGLPAPYGHLAAGKEMDSVAFYLDIVGSVVGSLCAAHAAAAGWDGASHRVNLLFDHDGPDLRVETPYPHGVLRITLKRPGPLFVRLPPWLRLEEVARQDGGPQPRLANGYLWLADAAVGAPIELRLPLKPATLTLGGSLHARPIRLRLLGDSPVAMDNFGTDLTFFEPYE